MIKILIVDDEESVRNRLSSFLNKEGYQAYTAENGLVGLEIIEREKPDIALVDIKMPGIDGIETLKKIKKNNAKTEVIIITGYGRTQTAIEALQHGAFGYLKKPLDLDELEIELARALEKQETARELDEHVKRLETLVIEKNLEIKHRIQIEDELSISNEKLERELRERKLAEKALLKEKENLKEALSEIKTLKGIIPICSYCKQIRNDKGAWDIMEAYITEHTDAEFSHGVCPDCYKKQMEDLELREKK